MSADFNMMATIWLICGFATATWAVIDKFHGGENSKIRPILQTRFPGATGGSPAMMFAGFAIGVVLCVIVWPVPLTAWGWEEWKSRKARLQYAHPRLRTLATRLTEHEGDYATIFDQCGLPAVTRALHAIDPTSVKRRDLAPIDVTYGDIARCAGSYLLYAQKLKSGNPTEVTEARKLAAEMGNNPETAALSELSFAMGQLAVGYVHGRLPQDKFAEAKEVYVSHLLPEFNSDDHVRAVFSPINSR